jgi:hypothetical protein
MYVGINLYYCIKQNTHTMKLLELLQWVESLAPFIGDGVYNIRNHEGVATIMTTYSDDCAAELITKGYNGSITDNGHIEFILVRDGFQKRIVMTS